MLQLWLNINLLLTLHQAEILFPILREEKKIIMNYWGKHFTNKSTAEDLFENAFKEQLIVLKFYKLVCISTIYMRVEEFRLQNFGVKNVLHFCTWLLSGSCQKCWSNHHLLCSQIDLITQFRHRWQSFELALDFSPQFCILFMQSW